MFFLYRVLLAVCTLFFCIDVAYAQGIAEKSNIFDATLYSASLAVSPQRDIAVATQYPFDGLYVYSLGEKIQNKAVINGFASPRAVVFSRSKKNHFYVTDSTRGAVLEVSITSNSFAVQRSIDVGQGAFGMAIHPSKEVLYITNPTSGVLTVVDMREGRIIKTLTGFKGVQDALAVASNGHLYIAKPDNTVAVYDTETISLLYEFKNIKGISAIAINKESTRVYITSTFYNMLFSCATELKQLISSTPVGYMPKSLVVSDDNSSIIVVNEQDSTVSIVDTASLSVRRLIPLNTYALAPVSALGDPKKHPNTFLLLDKKMKLLRVSWEMGVVEAVSTL